MDEERILLRIARVLPTDETDGHRLVGAPELHFEHEVTILPLCSDHQPKQQILVAQSLTPPCAAPTEWPRLEHAALPAGKSHRFGNVGVNRIMVTKMEVSELQGETPPSLAP